MDKKLEKLAYFAYLMLSLDILALKMADDGWPLDGGEQEDLGGWRPNLSTTQDSLEHHL